LLRKSIEINSAGFSIISVCVRVRFFQQDSKAQQYKKKEEAD